MMAWVAFEPMLLGSLTLGSSAAPFDLLHDAMRALLGLQREIQRSLASEFRAARESSSARSSLVLMGMAFAFGAVHAEGVKSPSRRTARTSEEKAEADRERE